MRSFLKIFLTALVLAGAFVGYLVFQPQAAVRSLATSRPVAQPLKKTDGGTIIGEGENAWVRQFDDFGNLSSRFRAQKWEPQKNSLVRVVRPEAELFLKGGKDKDGKDKPRPRVTIRGEDGEVVVQSLPEVAAADKPLAAGQGMSPSGRGPAMSPPQAPSSGRLNGVVIEVFETENGTEPVVTLTTNNIVFDNETFRISTEAYTGADGKLVEPDQVPVEVEGRDVDFYGRGLTVRWNDLDERLELLRIAHGERLVIKNVEALSKEGGLPAAVPTTHPASAARPQPLWWALASADPAAALALAAADKIARPNTPTSKPARRKHKPSEGDKEEPTYRATFEDDVRVVQGEQQLAVAKLMNVDFLLGQKKPAPAATQPAASQPASSQPVATQPVAAGSATTRAATTQPNADETDVATTQPTTAPAQQPVTVYWTGELNVMPLVSGGPSTAPTTAPAAATEPLTPGEARVELVGAPVLLTRDQLEVRTARFIYRTDGTDGRLALESAADFPRVQITQKPTDGRGADTQISTEGLAYSTKDRIATLRGDSRVLAPTGTAKGGAAEQMLDASWRELATFRLVGQREQDLWVEHADLTGAVDVKAPQGQLRSQRLELAFDAPTGPATRPAADDELASARPEKSQPNLRRIIATDNVFCELIDAKEGSRKVECQRLALDTAHGDGGDLYPSVVDAGGGVHASTRDQTLEAGHVLLRLRPAPRGPGHAQAALDEAGVALGEDAAAVELESMTASESVRVASKDGGVATGRQLHVTVGDDGHPQVELSGDPARVENAANGTLTGPRIIVDPKSGVAHVPGPGTLRTVQRDAKKDPPDRHDAPAGRPIEVTWADHADVRSSDNRIEIAGAVTVWITDADGSVRTANAGRVEVELAPRPAQAPRDGEAREGEAPAEPPSRDAKGSGSAGASPSHGASRPRSDQLGQSMNIDLFKDKEVAAVHLREDAVLNSRLAAADGTLLQQFHLKAREMTYDVRGRRLVVPGPGQMLVETHEHRAAGDEPQQAGADGAAAGVMAAGNGTTAFQWGRSLEYSESDGRMVLDGSVVVSHQPDASGDKKQPPIRLDADRLTALFEPQERADAAKPVAAPAPGDLGSKLRLRSVEARGNILISREGSELAAAGIDYDPTGEWVIARGTDRAPATFSVPGGAGTVHAGELWLNTKTWGVKVKDVNTRVGGLAR
jgi:hypothetical protein